MNSIACLDTYCVALGMLDRSVTNAVLAELSRSGSEGLQFVTPCGEAGLIENPSPNLVIPNSNLFCNPQNHKPW